MTKDDVILTQNDVILTQSDISVTTDDVIMTKDDVTVTKEDFVRVILEVTKDPRMMEVLKLVQNRPLCLKCGQDK